MNTIKHPATFSERFIPIFASLLSGTESVLDPLAGTGKLARIKEYGYVGRVVCNELEPEWVDGHAVDEWHFTDAAAMSWAADQSFDAICTSPTYGNRMADHQDARDQSKRITYRHMLRRPLHPENTGSMQWGARYRLKHQAIYRECLRVLKAGGILIVNVSDHIREGKRQYVADWHRDALETMGLTLTDDLAIPTRRMGFGANRGVRVECERILVFRRPGAGREENIGANTTNTPNLG